MHSRKTNVGRCSTGNVGMNRAKNMCRHSSRKTDVMEFALTAAVTLDDCSNVSFNIQCIHIFIHKCEGVLSW